MLECDRPENNQFKYCKYFHICVPRSSILYELSFVLKWRQCNGCKNILEQGRHSIGTIDLNYYCESMADMSCKMILWNSTNVWLNLEAEVLKDTLNADSRYMFKHISGSNIFHHTLWANNADPSRIMQVNYAIIWPQGYIFHKASENDHLTGNLTFSLHNVTFLLQFSVM